jgi:cyclopropane-fatty-acyl-phospholipid synthase
MKADKLQKMVAQILAPADVMINGDRPWDIQVHTPKFFERVLSGGSLALGESYMDGWWDCTALDQFFTKILGSRLDQSVKTHWLPLLWFRLRSKLFNAQNRSKAYIIGKRHYDQGNHLFSKMLDRGMNYSCAYWDNAQTLEDAQRAKLDLTCCKMGIGPGMKVLDIGCGWGGFAKYAAQTYGAQVHGITVSREQVDYAQAICQGLDVDIQFKDYREVSGTFDRIVSIGMFEHVGSRNYRTFMRVVHRRLAADGLFLLHTIGRNTSTHTTDPWVAKYIFPNSMLPSAKQITAAAERLFVLEDWHSFGQYYDPTLLSWDRNFTQHWSELQHEYDERFYRMWRYYLLSSAGAFRARRNQVWQIVFSKGGFKGGYTVRR